MPRRNHFGIAISLALAANACGADSEPDQPVTLGTGGSRPTGCGADAVSVAVTTGEYAPEPAPGSECGAVVTQEPIPTSPVVHSPACSALRYSSNPPSSGDHYGAWTDFRHYEQAVARGNWVHSLEHGAIVVVYNCTDCDDEIAEAVAWMDTLPEDPSCARYGRKRRLVLTPDPLLDVRWAAASWGYTLRSDCFEPQVFTDFAVAHVRNAPEDLCATP